MCSCIPLLHQVFFLILERIQLLNRSTLCLIHLVLSTVQKSSVFTCSEGFSFHLFLRSLGFCRLPSLQDFRFAFLCQGCAYKWEYRTNIPWTFFSGLSSHTVPLFCPCINLVRRAIASICADAQCTKSKIEKYLAHHSLCQYRAVSAWQKQCAAA